MSSVAGLLAGVAVAGSLLTAGPPAAADNGPCSYDDELVASIVVDRPAVGRFVVRLTPTEEARTRGTLEYAAGSHAVTDDLWRAVRGCMPAARGTTAESLHQQLECHVWLGLAAGATGPSFDLESWRRPLPHPGLAAYVRTQCLNAEPAGAAASGPDHWQLLWSGVGASVARWSAAARV